jgi:ribosomal protein S18 acetylase RimI-like enzyme
MTELISEVEIRALTIDDRNWVAMRLEQNWGSTRVVSRGCLYYAHTLPGCVAMHEDEIAGLLTYNIDGDAIEIVTLNSFKPGLGIGTSLLEAVRKAALENNPPFRRLWLITTNDNLPALRFYQKRGFEIVTFHRNAVADARKLKPEIPLFGLEGIPIRDEIELELPLNKPLKPEI